MTNHVEDLKEEVSCWIQKPCSRIPARHFRARFFPRPFLTGRVVGPDYYMVSDQNTFSTSAHQMSLFHRICSKAAWFGTETMWYKTFMSKQSVYVEIFNPSQSNGCALIRMQRTSKFSLTSWAALSLVSSAARGESNSITSLTPPPSTC